MDRRSWSVTAIATAVAATVVLLRPAWLPLVEKTFALVGAVWVVLPFFRDSRLREMWSLLTEAPTGQGGFEEVRASLRKRMEMELRSFNPRDRSDTRIGLIFLVLSFAIGVVHELSALLASPGQIPH
jgi:hypothetical protein